MLENGQRFDASNGWDAETLFRNTQRFYSTGQRVPHGTTCSFEDVLILPGVQQMDESAINISTRLTRSSPYLPVPIVAGPSETACGCNMAISMALAGGIGVLHRNQSIEDQVAMVKRVKQFHNGFILDPYVLSPFAKVSDVDKIREEHGCGCVPITDNGKLEGKLQGLVTSRDIESLEDRSVSVRKVMTQAEDLIVAKEPVQLRNLSQVGPNTRSGAQDTQKKAEDPDVEDILFQSKVGKLPIVDEENRLFALLCRGDVNRVREFPFAARDPTRQLLCAASVAANNQDDWVRIQAVVNAGVDILYLDTDDGVTQTTVDFLRQIKEDQDTANVEVLAGRVSSVEQAEALLSAGVDGLLVGCFACGGAAEATCLFEIARLARVTYGVPVCADEVRDATQMFKALCLGASAVTMTSTVARCEEAPGNHLYREGVRVRLHPKEVLCQARPAGAGQGVLGEPIVQKGIVGGIVDRGSVRSLLPHLAHTVRRGLQELGQPTIPDAHAALHSGEMRMERQISQTKMSGEEHPRTVRLESSALHNRWGSAPVAS
jgi:IMP dehydrogenase